MVLRQNYSGFTLIELSIVLVIIGLIVGGVLVGRDLINAAEIRATVRQIEQFNAAANAFRSKYNCLPGDCADAEEFGFDPLSKGNGDGVIGVINIGDCSGLGFSCPFIHEYIDFWYHLSAAGFIANTIKPYHLLSQSNPSVDFAGGTATPPVKLTSLGAAAGWGVYNFKDAYFILSPVATALGKVPPRGFLLNSSALPDIGVATVAGYFSPSSIYVIDQKLDDGLPLSGIARAWSMASGNAFWIESGPSGNNSCITDSEVPQYNVQYAGPATNPHETFPGDSFYGLCSLMLQASF